MIYIIFFLLLNFGQAEWVEITPFRNVRNTSAKISKLHSQTTPLPYEPMQRTPNLKTDFTTPAYDDLQYSTTKHDSKLMETIYVNQTLSSEDVFDSNIKSSPFTEFSTFLQVIQQNLLQLASSENKFFVLENLKDTLINNLHTHISNLWKSRNQQNVQRSFSNRNSQARGYKNDYEMDFPSNEGALMTIGFLTFAVFLIKLVIKLVHALKYKYQYYSTTTTTTAATLVLLKRKKREEFDEQTAKITGYVEKLPY